MGRESAEAGAAPEAVYALKLAVEELGLNILNHGYGGEAGPITVELSDGPEVITLTITDSAPPFSPEEAPAADTSSPWHERQIGGYGWHLVKTMMDRVEHEITPGGGNRVRLTRSKA